MENLLRSIVEEGAEIAIIDITGAAAVLGRGDCLRESVNTGRPFIAAFSDFTL